MELLELVKIAQSLPDQSDALDKILAHDKWKTEAKFAHEIQLEELRQQGRPLASRSTLAQKSSATPSTFQHTPEDLELNKLTSYGACDERHLGLIAKTKIYAGAQKKADIILPRWMSKVEECKQAPLKDLKEGRIKSLLLAFLWASGCGHRICQWPDASDIHYVDSLKKDLQERFSKFSSHSIVAAYEALKLHWLEVNDDQACSFNSSMLSEILDNAYTSVTETKELEHRVDIKNSPLFVKFAEAFPDVSLESLEKYYVKNRRKFVPAAVSALRKRFTEIPPKELKDKYPEAEWKKKWHIYLVGYEEKWPTQLKQIYQSTKEDQELWKKE